MPTSIIYLIIMLVAVYIWLMILKRPIWEAMGVTFLVLLAVSNTWNQFPAFFEAGVTSSLLYSMIVFILMSSLITKTKLIDGAVNLILALLGKLPGGAGYAAVLAASFMGALSGSGPGNVMATGPITIKTMKQSGYSAELAANIESNSAALGNMIPPSANIVAALGALTTYWASMNMDVEMSIGSFWVVCWGCSIWFILSRLVMVFIFVKKNKIKAMDADKIPSIKETLKTNWQGLLLPAVILVPFIIDFLFNNTTAFPQLAIFVTRLTAAGAKKYSSSLLFFVAGLASILAVIIMQFKNKEVVSAKNLLKYFTACSKSVASTVGTCLFGYMIGALFASLDLTTDLGAFLNTLNMSRVGLAFIIPLISCFIGMVIPGSSMISIFGSMFVAMFAAKGTNPVLVAAMLPCFCGVMSAITPPLALAMYASISIAESDVNKTIKNDLWWVGAQYLLEVVILLGLLPIIGL